jgi:hypothetical protein
MMFYFLFRDLIAFYFSVRDLIAFYLCIYRPDCLFVYLGLFVQIVDLLSISQPIQQTTNELSMGQHIQDTKNMIKSEWSLYEVRISQVRKSFYGDTGYQTHP